MDVRTVVVAFAVSQRGPSHFSLRWNFKPDLKKNCCHALISNRSKKNFFFTSSQNIIKGYITLSLFDRSLFQIFRLFFPRKVGLLIVVPEGILFQNHYILTSPTWTTSRDIAMTSSYLKNSLLAWKNWINAAIGINSKFRY